MESLEDTNIIDSLYKGLDILDTLLNTCPDKTQIITYENLFLTEDEVFDNNIIRYLDHLDNKPDTQLWTHLVKNCEQNEIICFMEKFIKYLVNTKDNNTLINILTKLFEPIDTNKLPIIQTNKIFHMLIENINDENWTDKITSVYIFLDMIDLLDRFVTWSEQIENDYRVKKNIDINDRYIPSLPDIRIANIVGILLTAWSFCNDENLTIETPYIMDKSCHIQWFTKKYNSPKKYNIITKLFYSILNGLRVGIIPICYRYVSFKVEIDNLNNIISQHNNVMIRGIYANQKQQYEKYFNDAKQIINIYDFPNLINAFYVGTFHIFKIMRMEHDIIIDDIFNDMSFYMISYYDLYKKSFLTKELCHFLLELITTKTYTNSTSIKYDFITIISNIIIELNMSSHNDLLIEYAQALIILYNDIQQTDIPMTQQLSQQLEIQKFIIKTLKLKNINFSNVIINFLVKNINITRKMLHNILTTLSELDDINNKIFKELKNVRTVTFRTSMIMNDLEKDVFERVVMYVDILKFLDVFVKMIGSDIILIEMLLSEELMTSLVTILNQNVNRLCTTYNFKSNLGFKYLVNKSIDMENYVSYIMNILNTLNKHSDMSQFICAHIFDINNYDKLKKYVNNSQYDEMFEKLHNDNVVDDIEYPDEFYDPLTCTLISNPCLIPNMNGFDDLYFDRSTIMKQLLIKEENPYTRGPLSLKEFEDYNNLDEIKNKNKIFKEKIMNYK